MSALSKLNDKNELDKKVIIGNSVSSSELNESYDKFCKNDNEQEKNNQDSNIDVKERKYHCRSPNIFTIDHFLTDEECEHMIKLSEPNLKQSLVSGEKKGIVSEGRTGKNCWLTHYHDEVTTKIANKISKMVDLPVENAEAFQMIHYDIGEEYKQHYDGWLFDGCERSRRNMRHGGQRMKTALCYLNNVDEGGSTFFPRLGLHVYPERGKMVVFQNVIDNCHDRHPLSEHCAMPVIKGHKWGFNLWFRESSRKKIYNYVVDPKYLKNKNAGPKTVNLPIVNNQSTTNNKQEISKKEIDDSVSKDKIIRTDDKQVYNVIDDKNSIFTVKNFIEKKDMVKLLTLAKTKFKEIQEGDLRQKAWISKNDFPKLISDIEKILGLSKFHFENIFVVNYIEAQTHSDHFDAYDINSENGKKFTDQLGQRIITFTGVIQKSVKYTFRKVNKEINLESGDIIFYRNINYGSSIRNDQINKRIVCDNSNSCIFNIYLRENATNGINIKLTNVFFNTLLNQFIKTQESKRLNQMKTNEKENNTKAIDDKVNDSKIDVIVDQIVTTEIETSVNSLVSKTDSNCKTDNNNFNYTDLLLKVYQKVEKGEKLESGYSEMIFNSKVNWNMLKSNIIKLYTIRKKNNNSILNLVNLEKSYYIDETTPVIVENVYLPEAIDVFKKYIEINIYKGAFILGDKQSKRYKAHNESLCRFMHYELLPLAEKIVGITLEPTYTYLSCYRKGCDLPSHTDRPECEYTVSFIIDKPKGFEWLIYLHKEKQTHKNKGRSNFTPDKSECLALDCNSNGLMIFKGEDHVHFREKLEADYYNIVLLHYRDVNKKNKK